MKKSKILRINLRDFLKGLIVSVIGAVLTSATTALQTGTADIKIIGSGAAIAGLSYIGKNLLDNSEGKFLTPEPHD